MAAETNIIAKDLIYLFDKKTGEKFYKQSTVDFCRITHYSIKSEKTGKTVLLSAEGIKRRFTQTPNTEREKTKTIFNWLPKFL